MVVAAPFRIALAIAVALVATPADAESSNALAAAKESITAAELYKHVEVLADDVYEGRAAGSRGGRAAARYLIHELEPYGLIPAGDAGTFVQRFRGNSQNLLALHPGYDPELKQEIVVVGAHYDHVGYGSRNNSFGPFGKIHNGADDNASGTALMLETMEAFATSGLRTRRSILFAFWDAEEGGLLGSRYWLAHPTIELERVRFAITVDMVGRLRGGQLYVLGTRSGFGMRRLVSGPVDGPLWLDFSWELHDNSDHWSFLEKRVPIVLLHTGLHRDYHRPSDDVEKIDSDGLRRVSQYLLGMLIQVANADQLPAFRSRASGETVAQQRTFERPLKPMSFESWPADVPRPRLGISWREDKAEPGSVFLTRVVGGSPAAAAGLAVRDRVYDVNGEPFADAIAFESTINSLLKDNRPSFTLLVETRGHIRTVTVQMPPATGSAPHTGQDSAAPEP